MRVSCQPQVITVEETGADLQIGGDNAFSCCEAHLISMVSDEYITKRDRR